MTYRVAAERVPDLPPHTFKPGDKVRLYDNGKPSSVTGVVVCTSDTIIGVDLDGGGYFQCGPHRWRAHWWNR